MFEGHAESFVHAVAHVGDERKHVGGGGVADVDEEIGVAVADLRVADAEALETKIINHAPRGRTRRIFKDASSTFLAQRLASSAFFVADTNPLENFLERLGGKFQFHCQHHIIRRKRSVAVFKGNLFAAKGFEFALGGAIEFYFADVGADLHAVSAGVHAQRAAHGAGNADQTFHAAEIVLGAVGHGAAEVGGGVHVRKIAFEGHFRLGARQLQDEPGEFTVLHEQV